METVNNTQNVTNLLLMMSPKQRIYIATLHATKAQYEDKDTTSCSRQPHALTSVFLRASYQSESSAGCRSRQAPTPTYHITWYMLRKIRQVLFANIIIRLIETTNPLVTA